VATVVYGDYEWDDSKAAENLVKHGVSFEEAAAALENDTMSIDLPDALDPSRIVSVAMSPATRVLYVVSADVTDRIRIISARLATAAEEAAYAQGG
jgi:hypothetical protein